VTVTAAAAAAAVTLHHTRHLVKFAQQEPLLLLSCTVKGHSLAHMAAEAGSLDTLQLLVQLVGRYAVRLSARLEEVLSWSASGSEMLKTMRWVGAVRGVGAVVVL
jgi:hypothetical protein